MKEQHYNEIKEHVPSIVHYQKEVQLIEHFFNEKQLNIEEATPVFWNHVITLFKRIDADEQNHLELDPPEEMSEDAQKLVTEFEEYLDQHRAFDISEFEKYLLTIYFEQLTKNKGE